MSTCSGPPWKRRHRPAGPSRREIIAEYGEEARGGYKSETKSF